jgi:L-alanine-DL-glutamate epimerase-like enolase superfamily enzyme
VCRARDWVCPGYSGIVAELIGVVPRLRIVETRLGIRTAHSRMPFRYGLVTVHAAPIATLEVTIETERGERSRGYAADFLAYRWFDKRVHKSLVENVADLVCAIRLAVAACQACSAYCSAFDIWWNCLCEVTRQRTVHDLNELTVSFGASMPERAVIDGLGRLLGLPVADLIASGALGIDLGRLDHEFEKVDLRYCLPKNPLGTLWIRHTVGLVDPLSAKDRRDGTGPSDGLPVTLEDYLRSDGIKFLKIKVAGRLEEDLRRLTSIAEILSYGGFRCAVTLDGNEQYYDLGAFAELVGRLRATRELQALYRAILFIEQPLERSVALDPQNAPLLERISRHKPLIIDEADGTLASFRTAISLGYSGVSHKNCKGIYKSFLNLARAQRRNESLGSQRYFLSAEDLTNLPVVPLQADLALVALLGISHVERNGHHYFFGLDHLTPEEQIAALDKHSDLYARFGDAAVLRIRDGRVAIDSIQVPGMGFAALPAMDAMVSPEQWLAEHAASDSLGN